MTKSQSPIANSHNYNPEWTATFHAKLGSVVEYKYVIYDLQSGEIIDHILILYYRAEFRVESDSPFRVVVARQLTVGS